MPKQKRFCIRNVHHLHVHRKSILKEAWKVQRDDAPQRSTGIGKLVASKKAIHNLGKVEYFELYEIFFKDPMLYSKYWAGSVIYCTCRNCLIPTEQTRRLTKEKFDALSILYFVSMGSCRGARNGENDNQREYHQARTCSREGLSSNYNSILDRFQKHDTYRESQMAIGWTEDICSYLDQIANEDWSYIATKRERQRHEKTGSWL